jgi:Rrf2 family protein
MLFSKACEYGIRATIYIATQSLQNNRVSLVEIATEIDSPQSFTAKILQKLARDKVITSVKGQMGGYEIKKEDMAKITLGHIVMAIDGGDIYTVCGLGLKKCSEKHPCPVHANFKVIREKVRKTLDNTNLEMLASSIDGGQSYLKI